MILKRALVLAIAILFTCCSLSAQTVSGTITDSSNNEQLVQANVFDKASKQVGVSNNYGFYSLSLKTDTVDLVFSYVGYQSQNRRFVLHQDTVINVPLVPSNTLKTVEIIAAKQAENVAQRTQVSVLNIPIEQLKSVPNIAGEADIMKSLQLLPGIQFGQEGSSNIFVRGGTPDQNLILLDDVPIYNVNHLFGFFSIFSPDAIKSVEVLKGGFPARYGGRLSSVLDIRTKEGNMYKYNGSLNVGLIASHFSVEGPIKKEKASFYVTGRRTYIDLLIQPFSAISYKKQGIKGKAGYYFYDATCKLKYIVDEKNKLYLSFYGGQDQNYTKLKALNADVDTLKQGNSNNYLKWGNATLSLRWNRIYNSKTFSNFTLAYTQYSFGTGSSYNNNNDDDPYSALFSYNSTIRDAFFKQDFDWYLNPQSTIKFGSVQSVKFYSPNVNIITTQSNTLNTDTLIGVPLFTTYEISNFIEDDQAINTKLKLNIGLRHNLFATKGYLKNSIEPRLALRYLFTPNFSVKAAYGYVTQNLHLLTNSGVGAPTDLWVPATKRIIPENSHQISGGFFANYKALDLSIEGFYKTMNNVIEYKEGASFANSFQNWEDKVAIGKGTSYGTELFIHKKEGKTNGWLSYTLSWTNRLFEELNNGKVFPFKYDRRHYFNVFFNQQLKKKNRNVSLSWTYATGSAVTLPSQKQNTIDPNYTGYFDNILNGQLNSFSGQTTYAPSRNNYRMRDYHRLDLAYNATKIKKHGERTWSLGIYNLYARRNPFYLYQEQNYDDVIIRDDQGHWIGTQSVYKGTTIKEFSLFSFIPFISYQFKYK